MRSSFRFTGMSSAIRILVDALAVADDGGRFGVWLFVRARSVRSTRGKASRIGENGGASGECRVCERTVLEFADGPQRTGSGAPTQSDEFHVRGRTLSYKTRCARRPSRRDPRFGDYDSTSPWVRAYRMRPGVFVTPSFSRIRPRYVLTVFTLRFRVCAMSVTDFPRPINRNTSSSRAESAS